MTDRTIGADSVSPEPNEGGRDSTPQFGEMGDSAASQSKETSTPRRRKRRRKKAPKDDRESSAVAVQEEPEAEGGRRRRSSSRRRTKDSAAETEDTAGGEGEEKPDELQAVVAGEGDAPGEGVSARPQVRMTAHPRMARKEKSAQSLPRPSVASAAPGRRAPGAGGPLAMALLRSN